MGVLLEFGQIGEGVDAIQLTRMDQAHEQVAHSGSVLCLVEVGIFAMENRLFEGSFTDVVI